MGGLCNGKLGGKFNEVFSELMEGDLSQACRYFALSCFAAFSLIRLKHRLQSISNIAPIHPKGRLMGSPSRFQDCVPHMPFQCQSNAASSLINWLDIFT